MIGTPPGAAARPGASRVATLRRAAFSLFWTAVGILFALPALSAGLAAREPLLESLAA